MLPAVALGLFLETPMPPDTLARASPPTYRADPIEENPIPRPSEAAIAAAIAQGIAGDGHGTVILGRTGPGQYRIAVSGPLGRIRTAAAQAARQRKPFSRADVTEEMSRPLLAIAADPSPPARRAGRLVIAPRADEVVLRPGGVRTPRRAVRAESMVRKARDWSALGVKSEGTELLALFPMPVLRALPPGDIEVVLVTDAGELRYTLPEARRKSID